MARLLWPILLASAVSLLPFTVFSTFLVPISEDADSGVAAMGGLRGLGGLASLAVGVACAPLIDRVRTDLVTAAGLALLGVSAVLGAAGHFLALAVFCFLVGAATSVLGPALATAAANRFDSAAASGRAATLVTATQSLAAMLAAPLVVAPGLLWGWQGNLLAVAAIALVLAALFLVRGRRAVVAGPSTSDARIGYLASFAALARIPGAVPLLLIALLRTAAFMGYLSYLAAFYDERFALEPGPFAFVWTLSGASFFVGNLITGRLTNRASARIGTERVLQAGLVTAALAMGGFYLTESLPVALLLTAALGGAHAVVAACLIGLLVRRCPDLRGAALGLNAAGMSLGVFAGAALGGAGLAVAGYPGIGVVLGGITLLALILGVLVRRSPAA
ncbi:MFS transporter [Amycolatopsis antarctica]|uniref:MFS transporter n=2 Tax=Amycolatopsis antarctica TaxID=1854586 RepID=A0A263D885_9PSEU|nr:MFS transporter [Amycolatopsis antarctica]